MITLGDGSFQKAIDNGLCPRCEAAVDYHEEIVTCNVCDLTMAGAGIQKQKDPNQLELPSKGEQHGTEETE
jgi:predicted amidophosphoribosyltransferase